MESFNFRAIRYVNRTFFVIESYLNVQINLHLNITL